MRCNNKECSQVLETSTLINKISFLVRDIVQKYYLYAFNRKNCRCNPDIPVRQLQISNECIICCKGDISQAVKEKQVQKSLQDLDELLRLKVDKKKEAQVEKKKMFLAFLKKIRHDSKLKSVLAQSKYNVVDLYQLDVFKAI